MKSCSWLWMVLVLTFSVGPQFCLQADEDKQDTPTVDEAKAKPAAEEPRDGNSKALHEMIEVLLAE